MQWENSKILLLCHADIVCCKTCGSHISPAKHKTYLVKTSLFMETRTEENPWGNFQPLHSYCSFPAALLPSMSHLCNGTGVEGKVSPSSRSRGITAPAQWPSTLSPDWSQLTFIPKITPDDTPGGFSMQLMIEYSLYSRSWLCGYGRTLHCQSLYCRHCEERVCHSVQLLSTAFNIIWSKYKETPMWLSYNFCRLKDYLSATTVSFDFCIR